MQAISVKRLMNACLQARKITGMFPELPVHMVPRHNNVIDAVYTLSQEKDKVYIRDVCRWLELTPPSVTKMIGELEALGILRKISDEQDKRFVYLQLTDKGLQHYETYVNSYHTRLAECLDISDDDAATTYRTINALYEQLHSLNQAGKSAAP